MDETIAITGHKGRLGSMLIGEPTKKLKFVPLDCDITDPSSIALAIKEVVPDVIINCAAFTDVDLAEHQYTKALGVNQYGVLYLREAFDGWLIQISTDYVFGGMRGPYKENTDFEDDFSKGKYGRSKAYGEQYVLSMPDRFGTIVRTTMLYGNPLYPDFVSKVLDQLKQGMPFEVPYTLMGSPTYIPHFIEGLIALIEKHWHNPPPIVNIVGSDVISRYDFALMIASVFGYDKTLVVPTRKVRGDAERPRKAGLTAKFASKLKIPIYSIIEGLEEYKNEREEIQKM